MCNLYSMSRSRAEVGRLFRVSDNRMSTFEQRDAIFPGHAAPVVRSANDGTRELVTMSWGFVLPQPGKIACGFRRNADTDSDPLRTAFR